MSDFAALPTAVAHAALGDGILIGGDEEVVESTRDRVAERYNATADDRKRERREFVRQLAGGDA